MNQYFVISDDKNGKLAISSLVFENIADSVLNDMIENEYKNKLLKSYEKKKTKAKVSISKDKVNVECLLIISKDADLKTLSDAVKDTIYENIYRQTEISNIKIITTILLTD